MITIAITDDHPLVVQGLKDMLSDETDLKITADFINAHLTATGIAETQPAVLLLDINLPDMDGIELCKKLHGAYPELGIIGLTSNDEVSMAKALMRNGARGYLLKTVSKEELIAAIKTVADGGEYIQPAMQQRIVDAAMGREKTVGGSPRLTTREKEVLALIMKEHTTQEIAVQLFISPKTVESHRAVLFQKFGVRNVAGLVKQAIEHGSA